MIALAAGLAATAILGELPVTIANLVAPMFGHPATFVRPAWLPHVSFTWFALIGASVVFAIGVLFPTPPERLAATKRAATDAAAERCASEW